MTEIGMAKSELTTRKIVEPASRNNMTLADYYAYRQRRYITDPPTVYDRDLKRIFSDDPRRRRAPLATMFLRRHGARIRGTVAKWTGQYQLNIDAVLDDMMIRCRDLNLRAAGPERQLVIDFTALLTSKIVKSLYNHTRRPWFAL
jgi:hypothetical protein